jgi:hypothetical protein
MCELEWRDESKLTIKIDLRDIWTEKEDQMNLMNDQCVILKKLIDNISKKVTISKRRYVEGSGFNFKPDQKLTTSYQISLGVWLGRAAY